MKSLRTVLFALSALLFSLPPAAAQQFINAPAQPHAHQRTHAHGYSYARTECYPNCGRDGARQRYGCRRREFKFYAFVFEPILQPQHDKHRSFVRAGRACGGGFGDGDV